MDPTLQELLARAQAAQQRGLDPAEIDRSIGQETAGRYGSFAALDSAVTARAARAVSAAAPAEPSRFGIGDAGRMVAEGATMGHVDELMGLLARLPGGKTPEQARGASQERVDTLRRDHPFKSGAADLAGALLPIGGPAGYAIRGARAARAARPAGAAIRAIETAITAPRGKILARGARAGLEVAGGGLARGAGAGALLGGVETAGRGEAESFGEYVRAGVPGAVVGGLLGGTAGLIFKGPAAGRAAAETRRLSAEHMNDRIAGQARALSDGDITIAGYRDEIAKLRDDTQAGFRAFEQDPVTVTPAMREALQSNAISDARGGSPALRGALSRFNNPGTPTRFVDAQEVAGAMQDRISKAFKDGEGNLARNLMESHSTFMQEVDNAFAEAPELRTAWRNVHYYPRMLDAGLKGGNLNERQIEDVMGAITDPKAQELFRVGLLENVIERFDRTTGEIIPTNEVRARIEAAIPDAARQQEFYEILMEEARDVRRQKWVDTLIKWGAFAFGGSSIAGGLILQD